MKIGIIWHCVYPWDVRLEKIADACTEQGHEVCIVSKGGRDLPETDSFRGSRVVRVFSDQSALPGWVTRAARYPLFVNPIWHSALLKTLTCYKIDLIIVRDLPLAMLAVWVGRHLSTPVILDMAENYPAALQAYHNPLYRPFLFNNAWLPRKYEELSLAQLQHVFVVADEQKCRLVKLGVPSEKLTLVGNTPTDSFIASSAEGNVSLPSDSHPHLLYVGKLDRHRGAHLLVRALPALLAEFPKLRLSLVGDGNDKLRLETLARETGVMEAVSLPGWIERAKLPALIRESTVCLIPHTRCEHTDTTLPNKLFDYLAYSKPTIASDCLPLRRVIEDEDCGTTFRSGDVSSLLAAIRSLLRDPYLKSKGINGRIAVERKYNWNLDKERLLNALERVACSWQAP